jgi:hypothetical protein
MDENLPRLGRELRKETCPQRVLDEVARRIAAQATAPSRFRSAVPALAVGLALLCVLAVWRWSAGGKVERGPKLAANPALDHARIAEQAEGALGFIGSILLDAGAHSETVISKRAIPPLRNSLETARNKIVNRLEL